MKFATILFATFLLLGVSCKKDLLNSSNGPYITNPTSYILIRETWAGPTTNGSSFLYIYDTSHLVSKIEQYEWGTYSVNGGQIQTFYDTSYYTFEYTNGLCSKSRVQSGGAEGYYAYEYNDQKLPVKRTLYYTATNNVQSYSFYKYDNANNLVEKTDSSDKLNFKDVFTYNTSNNLVSLTDYILWSGPQKLKYDWSTFDNKVNFIKAINGLPPTYVLDNNFHSFSSSSPNNPVDESYYVPVDVNQLFTAPNLTNYAYQYNDEGLPTQMITGPWTVTFEYEKYK